jgi:hypothetical protein
MAIWGMMSIKVMEHLVHGKQKLARRDAEKMVQLYLAGAVSNPKAKIRRAQATL